MFLVIVIIILVLFLVWKMGVLRKPAQCDCCGKELKGTQQKLFGTEAPFILCSECANKIPGVLYLYAKPNWTLEDYKNFLLWNEGTLQEREHFTPDHKYGNDGKIEIDTQHGLFRVGQGTIMRFAEVSSYEFGFKPESIKDGMLGSKVVGEEYFSFDVVVPRYFEEVILKRNVSYKAKQKGFISQKYEYSFSKEFLDIIQAFEITLYLVRKVQNEQQENSQTGTQGIDEIQKALALFMFDSLDEVTEENLKKQRNALIKAFHPDNNETNETYSQKINSSYELLLNFIKQEQ